MSTDFHVYGDVAPLKPIPRRPRTPSSTYFHVYGDVAPLKPSTS